MGESALNATFTAMAHTFGAPSFSPQFSAKLGGCLDELNLTSVTESFWQGFVQYATSDGPPDGSDRWYENATYNNHWLELNVTKTDLHDITVYEPCNWVSNMAYYHSVTAVCEHRATMPAASEPLDVDASCRLPCCTSSNPRWRKGKRKKAPAVV